MTSDLSPTMRRWELGRALRQIRESQGKTIEQVSGDLSETYGTGFSATKISRMETGKRGANPRDVRDLCDYYGVSEVEQGRLFNLAKAVRSETHLQWAKVAYSEYVAIEAHARSLRCYEPMFVPGIFQTVEYHRATIDSYAPTGTRPDLGADYAALIQVRSERQRRLIGPNALIIHAIIDENTLHRQVGTAVVMAAQLDRLAALSTQTNITLRVVPTSHGLYPGCESAGFSMLELDADEPAEDNSCYIEGLIGPTWAERAVDRLYVSRVFAHLESIALCADESRERIKCAAREFA